MMRFSKNVLLLLLMTLLICCTNVVQAAYSRADFPPVLMYHDVRETALNYFDVTTEDVSFVVQDRGLLHEDAKYSIPRIYMGLELGKEHLDRFSDYVNCYKKMPAELFVDRWEYFKD